jgi:hypothetical protein
MRTMMGVYTLNTRLDIRQHLAALAMLLTVGVPADEVDSSAQADNARWVNQQLEVSAEREKAEDELDAVKGRLKARFVDVGPIQRQRIYELADQHRKNERILADQAVISAELEKEHETLDASLESLLTEQTTVRDEIANLIQQLGTAEDVAAVDKLQQAFQQKHLQQSGLLRKIEATHQQRALTSAAQEALKARRAKVDEAQLWLAKEASPFLDDIRSQNDLELQVHRLKVRETMLATLSRQSADHLAALRTHKDQAAQQIADATERIDRRHDELRKIAEASEREAEVAVAQKEQEADRVQAKSASKARKILAALPKLKSSERRKLMRESVKAQKQVVEQRKKLLEHETTVRRYEVDIETANVTPTEVAEELREARDRLAYQRGQFDQAMARSLELAELAGEAQAFEEDYYAEVLAEAKSNKWRISVGISDRSFDDAEFLGTNFVNFGTQAAGTFVTDNALATTSPLVAAALANGPYGVQGLTSASVDPYYTSAYSRSRFEDQEFVAADPPNNVTLPADYAAFRGSEDRLDSTTGSSIALQRQISSKGGWTFGVGGRIGHHDLNLGATHLGGSLNPGNFLVEQYRHALVDVDDNTAKGFQDFIVAVNPHDPSLPGLLGDGTPSDDITAFSLRNSFDADILAVDLGLSVDYRGDRFGWTLGLGTTLTYIDGETSQQWRASWNDYSSNLPGNGFYDPVAPFTVAAGTATGEDTDSATELSLGAYVMAGGRYYITPVISIGVDIRYDFAGEDFQTDHVDLDLSSLTWELKLSYDF